jgi:uncharacterized LabA/DUF88 family protein
VDGAYFRGLVESLGQRCFADPRIPVDYGQFTQGFTKVFDYDCLAPQKSQESDADYAARVTEQKARFKTLRSLRGWHVVEGVVKRTGKHARQKEVDILIAVDMLTHTYRRNMHCVTFVAGDQDFRPLVEAVVREGMFIEIWYETASASSELILAADAHRALDPYFIHSTLERRYQNELPLPERSGQPNKSSEGGTLVARGIETDNNVVELYRSRGRFILIRPDQYNYGHFLHMRHEDSEFLKKVHELTYGKCEWTSSVYR